MPASSRAARARKAAIASPGRPREIKIGHVVRVLDGPLAPIPCASRTQYQRCEDCDEATCQVRHMMLEVRQAIAEVLDNRSLAAMRDADNDDFPVELSSQI